MFAEIFPVFCVGCNQFNEFLCNKCTESIKLSSEQTRSGFSFYSAFEYEGIMATTLSRIKDSHHFGYLRVLAGYLKESFEIEPTTQVLIPPSTKKAFRKRGFEPCYEMAKQAGWNVKKKLKRVRQTKDQQSLHFRQRQLNQENAFQLSEPGRYLLFDDVVTTGATVREMIRAVESAGGEIVGVLALCSTGPKGAN
ncbi:MAG TPA: phosphoribosyltransferase family protein [Microbacteriaceae bacterium]